MPVKFKALQKYKNFTGRNFDSDKKIHFFKYA